jgi:hypothetical protein
VAPFLSLSLSLSLSLFISLFLLPSRVIAGPVRAGTIPVELRSESGGAPIDAGELLQARGGHLLRNYSASAAGRVPESDFTGLVSAAKARGLIVVRHEWDKIHLPNRSFDTRTPPELSQAISSYPGGQGLFVVQFDSPLVEADRQQLDQHNLRYLSYFNHNAVLVMGAESDVARIAADERVVWTSLYQPAFRAKPTPDFRPTLASEYLVQLPAAAPPAAHDQVIALSSGSIRSYTAGIYTNHVGRFTLSAVDALLREPYVVAVDQQFDTILSGEREAIALTNTSPLYAGEPYQTGTQPVKTTYDYRQWLSNRGLLDTSAYRIAFVDTGLDSTNGGLLPYHPDLVRASTAWTNYSTSPDTRDTVGHGTLVAGMAIGDPAAPAGRVDSNNFYYGTGIAPRTKVLAQKVFSDFRSFSNTDPLTLANDAYYWGSTVQNHSYNTNNTAGQYTARSQEIDLAVRDTYGDAPVTPMPMTISAGNICQEEPAGCTTMVLAAGTAKNAITVGATESYRTTYSQCSGSAVRVPQDFHADSFRDVAYRSRRGTLDGRLKPDVLAPGTQISSTRTQLKINGPQEGEEFCNHTNEHPYTNEGYYSIDTGTSFSAPQVAAACVLLNKKRGVAALSPAMLKAAITGNAVSVMGGYDGYLGFGFQVGPRPNEIQGFGRLYLGDALSSQVTQTYLDESSWSPFTGAGQTRTRTFNVSTTSRPTVVVLAWTDEPGNVTLSGSSPVLVRDLDLTVATGSGQAYTGNQMNSGEQSIAQSSPYVYDRRNNVEMIVIPPFTLSNFTISVTSASWGFGYANQPFAVFVSNAY